MMDMMPYSSGGAMVPRVGAPLEGTHCVFFTMTSMEFYELLLEKLPAWFDGRDEVSLVDHGTTDKQGLQFIALEWDGYEIDPLFLAILRDEEVVEDYTVYSREVA
jgi:hypothetical protein